MAMLRCTVVALLHVVAAEDGSADSLIRREGHKSDVRQHSNLFEAEDSEEAYSHHMDLAAIDIRRNKDRKSKTEDKTARYWTTKSGKRMVKYWKAKGSGGHWIVKSLSGPVTVPDSSEAHCDQCVTCTQDCICGLKADFDSFEVHPDAKLEDGTEDPNNALNTCARGANQCVSDSPLEGEDGVAGTPDDVPSACKVGDEYGGGCECFPSTGYLCTVAWAQGPFPLLGPQDMPETWRCPDDDPSIPQVAPDDH